MQNGMQVSNHRAITAAVRSLPKDSHGRQRETSSLWLKKMKLGHVGESYRETYFSLLKEVFPTARARKVDLVACQQPLVGEGQVPAEG